MPQVVGDFVATEAATADVVSIGVNDSVIAHVIVPVGGRTPMRRTAADSWHRPRLRIPRCQRRTAPAMGSAAASGDAAHGFRANGRNL